MPMQTVIQASEEQKEALLKKHLKSKLLPAFVGSEYSYDDEDDVGFVTLHTITGKKVEYQWRDSKPCFVSISGFGNIRYDISYPTGEMLEILTRKGKEVEEKFWKGGYI